MASDAHACLDEAAKASLAGRLFVVDHATLVDDLDSVLDDMRGRVIRPPFEVTPIFMPGFERGSCPLFIVKRRAEGRRQSADCDSVKNDETFSGAFRVSLRVTRSLSTHYMVALLAAIDARNLKPIGPPR